MPDGARPEVSGSAIEPVRPVPGCSRSFVGDFVAPEPVISGPKASELVIPESSPSVPVVLGPKMLLFIALGGPEADVPVAAPSVLPLPV
jgi:hypothetical protein